MKPSFFERITETISLRGRGSDYEEEITPEIKDDVTFGSWEATAEPTEGELTVDVFQTTNHIVIQTMVAGVSPDNLNVSVTREMVTIKGKREAPREATQDNYFYQELYWGAFSRTILLPAEIETEEVEATEKHGLLTIKLPKIDKGRIQNIKIKSL